MPVRFPPEFLKAMERKGKLADVLEHRLDVDDVAAAMGVHANTVRRWIRTGNRRFMLPALRLGSGKTNAYALRLYDVLRFAERTGRTVNGDLLPPAELAAWHHAHRVSPVRDNVLL